MPEWSISRAAGWYGDPFDRYDTRYWDGSRWTEQVRQGATETLDPPGHPSRAAWTSRVSQTSPRLSALSPKHLHGGVLLLALAVATGGALRVGTKPGGSEDSKSLGMAVIPTQPGVNGTEYGIRCERHPEGGECFPDVTITNTTSSPVVVSPSGQGLRIGARTYFSAGDDEDPEESVLNPGQSKDLTYRFDLPDDAIHDSATAVSITYQYGGYVASIQATLPTFSYSTPCTVAFSC